ncbi:MAG: hypothetical protein DYH06_12625, partial [Acidobacteria bacterium ACB2]|nr:hypothetical protein [Acidobacteria bacterium ACB2]
MHGGRQVPEPVRPGRQRVEELVDGRPRRRPNAGPAAAPPDLGEGLEEVILTKWNVAVGDQVELNAVLCTVETAKAEVEIPSPFAGRVLELGGAEGAVLAVGAPLVCIDTDADGR